MKRERFAKTAIAWRKAVAIALLAVVGGIGLVALLILAMVWSGVILTG